MLDAGQGAVEQLGVDPQFGLAGRVMAAVLGKFWCHFQGLVLHCFGYWDVSDTPDTKHGPYGVIPFWPA